MGLVRLSRPDPTLLDTSHTESVRGAGRMRRGGQVANLQRHDLAGTQRKHHYQRGFRIVAGDDLARLNLPAAVP